MLSLECFPCPSRPRLDHYSFIGTRVSCDNIRIGMLCISCTFVLVHFDDFQIRCISFVYIYSCFDLWPVLNPSEPIRWCRNFVEFCGVPECFQYCSRSRIGLAKDRDPKKCYISRELQQHIVNSTCR